MTLVNIDLRNQGYETGPDDRVIFYSLLVREGDFGTISTAPVEVPLVDGKASVDLAPGPVGVQIIAGMVADTRVREGKVPMEGPTTLNVVLTLLPDYSPSVRDEFLNAIRSAQDMALTRIDAEVAVAVGAEVGDVRDTAHQALAQSGAAVTVASTAELKADNSMSRVAALEKREQMDPQSPVDGQTANLLSQPDTLTRSAVGVVIQQDLVAVGPTVPPGFPEGKPLLWVDTSTPVEVTPPAPELGVSWADLPQVQGVGWRINGAPVAPGVQQVDPGMSMVSAHPEDGYVMTGRSQWIEDFTDVKIIADDFSGAAGGSALTGRVTPVGGAVWEAPRGALEGFPTSTGLFIADPPGAPARITMPVGGSGSHNVLDVGYADYRITFNAVVRPNNTAAVGVSLRCAESGGDTGVQWRWRWWSGYGLRAFRRIDGVNASFDDLPQSSAGLGWSGPVEITAHGDQITIRAVIGDVVFEDSVTYTENPGSTIIGIAMAANPTGTVQPYITNLQVVPL